ncbi:UPF0721 transmembrane protein [Novosphingobium marinum]|uniref:Probable membrane transporter protein n=2 Tax=Novosphingobium marinum TaxID=1514948 RepID=A0A7Y9Y065_9SPHN|nr:sulfite exporter TauE/SafE family protein [Novosphingobium marinum]NYH96226.1 putative membrane protein YfcA [Novosphingobium marinum]GGC33481.1 UPF0721 transmembrane protein [Novosphingobium marinum]
MPDTSLPLVVAALLAAGAGAGFAGGMFGIGGGFVVVPALMLVLPLIGAPSEQLAHLAVGTSLATIIFTSLRSVLAHARREAVDASVLRSWAPWVVLGTVGGAAIADLISSAMLASVFGAGVLLMAIHFLMPGFEVKPVATEMPGGAVRAGLAGGLGLFSAMLGIGGGTITTMVMTMCGSPIHRAIGTASGMGALIAVPGVIGFVVIGLGEQGLPFGSLGYVNLPAALAVIVTAILFAPLGVAAAHRLSPALLKRVFGIYLVVVGATMIAKSGVI